MTWSISSYRRLLVMLLMLVPLAGCAGRTAEIRPSGDVERGRYRIAVLPVENLSGGKAPLKELRQIFAERLKRQGFAVLPEVSLDQFMARHRVRYVGGIDEEEARLLAEEEGVNGVVVTSLEYFADGFPPKIAITARMTSTGADPRIVWMESVAESGNDSPGMFQTGVIREASKLSEKVLQQLAGSVASGFTAGFSPEQSKSQQKSFSPRQLFRKDLSPDQHFRLVVLPLYNRSGRKYAGEIMALHIIQEMRRLGNFQVVEPGMVRNKLLEYRLIMEGGMSLANADVIFDILRSNLVLTGKVMDYQDARGEAGIPSVDFSASIVNKESHTTVLSAQSYNTGDERVHMFELGKISTASTLADQMVRGIAEQLRLAVKTKG